MAKKHVYFFGAGAAEGNMKMKDVLGGKGANLAEMAGIGLPVPPGARASMPGMMDTILNLGLNDKTAAALVAKTGNERFVYDSYRRFVQMYGDVVLGLKPVHKDEIDPFEVIIEAKKHERGIKSDTDLTAADLEDLVARFKAAIKEKTGHDFPAAPVKQLWGAIGG